MKMWILLLILTLIPPSSPVVDHIELYEINHYYSGGELRLTQAIWWDWNYHFGYVVVDWRMMRDDTKNLGLAHPRKVNNKYEIIWYDKQTNTYRKIIAQDFRETRTTFDPELKSRKVWPQNARRKLSKSYSPKINKSGLPDADEW